MSIFFSIPGRSHRHCRRPDDVFPSHTNYQLTICPVPPPMPPFPVHSPQFTKLSKSPVEYLRSPITPKLITKQEKQFPHAKELMAELRTRLDARINENQKLTVDLDLKNKLFMERETAGGTKFGSDQGILRQGSCDKDLPARLIFSRNRKNPG